MAEEIESPAYEPDATNPDRRVRHRQTTPVRRARAAAPAKTVRAKSAPARSASAPKSRGRIVKPLRSLVVLSMVGGLVATVAIPAFAAGTGLPVEDSKTIQQMAVDDAQSFVAASDTTKTELSRESYSATTAEEIAKKKAAEAAAERARLAAKVASTISVDLTMVAPGSGEVRWPLSGFKLGEGFGARGGAHMGIDMLAPARTPIFAAAAGVVKVSQESYGGYGVAVVIEHVINGQRVGTLYGHMTYGSRQVVPGQTVEAGQIIGLVGSTGRSTANHLHFETYINGSNVDPWSWLQSNAG